MTVPTDADLSVVDRSATDRADADPYRPGPGADRFAMATDFDRPTPAVAVPGLVDSGAAAGLRVADGFVRGLGVVGRFEASPGLVALKVDPGPHERFLVGVRLTADEETAVWWERRVPDGVVPRRPHAARLLHVRSQGATRASVLLARRPGDHQLRASARVSYELTAAELPADGFLVVEVADETRAFPAGVTDRLAPRAAVGVRLDAVTVEPVTAAGVPAGGGTLDGLACERRGLVATGGGETPEDAAPGPVDVRGGMFVAAPSPTGGPVEWTLLPWLPRDAGPDRIPPVRPPAIPRQDLNDPPPSKRRKAVLMALHELRGLADRAAVRARHGGVRGLRVATTPLRSVPPGLAGELAGRGLVRATAYPLAGSAGTDLPLDVDHGPAGTIVVRTRGPLPGPVLVHLDARDARHATVARLAGAEVGWRLAAARY